MTKKLKLEFWEYVNQPYERGIELRTRYSDKPDTAFELSAEETARNTARFLMYSIRHDAFEIILDTIAHQIRVMLNDKKTIDILKKDFDIQNRIRNGLYNIADWDKEFNDAMTVKPSACTRPHVFNNPDCCICGKALTEDEWDNRHELHEPGCDHNWCDCDLPCHDTCCPECNGDKK